MSSFQYLCRNNIFISLTIDSNPTVFVPHPKSTNIPDVSNGPTTTPMPYMWWKSTLENCDKGS